MTKIKIGAQLVTVRYTMQTPEGILDTLEKVKAMGFTVVQLSGHGYIEPHLLADKIHELGLDVCITHNSYDRLMNDLDNVILEHKLLNCDAVGIGFLPKEFWGSKEGFSRFISDMNGVADKVYDAGMKFYYHNHNFEFERFDGRTVMDMLIEDTNPEKFGFILDNFWLQVGGVDTPEYIKRVEGRMKVMHLKDLKTINGERQFAEVGEGNINFKRIFKTLEETNVPYAVIEQDECDGDPFEALSLSKRNIEKMMEEMN